MPGIVRKLLVFASGDGLIVQAHGPVENHKAIQIDYKSKRVQEYSLDDDAIEKRQERLEAHGLIGKLRLPIPA